MPISHSPCRRRYIGPLPSCSSFHRKHRKLALLVPHAGSLKWRDATSDLASAKDEVNTFPPLIRHCFNLVQQVGEQKEGSTNAAEQPKATARRRRRKERITRAEYLSSTETTLCKWKREEQAGRQQRGYRSERFRERYFLRCESLKFESVSAEEHGKSLALIEPFHFIGVSRRRFVRG